jgi:hypothetical protein
MDTHTAKNQGYGLEIRTFEDQSGRTHIVFKSLDGSYHAFVEVEAKQAAIDCGSRLSRDENNTREHWKSLWDTRA